MALPITYQNLPGVNAQIQDGGLKVATPAPTLTQSVLLLGVATDGPINTPIQVSSLSSAERIFGATPAPTGYNATQALSKALTLRAYELLNAGCTDVRLCRVGGTQATVSLVDASGNNLNLSGNYPGIKYNALATAVVGTGSSSFVVLQTLDGLTWGFKFSQGSTTYGDLMLAINNSNLNITASGPAASAVVRLTPSTVYTQSQYLASGGIQYTYVPSATAQTVGIFYAPATNFTGGTDGTTPTDAAYSNLLNSAYAILEQYPVDCVVPLGAYLQPTLGLDATGGLTVANANNGDTVFFGQNLAQFCARLSVQTHSCFGVISIAPLQNPTYAAAVTRSQQLAGTQSAYGTFTTVPTTYSWFYQSGYTPAAGPLPGGVADQSGNLVNIQYLVNVIAGPDMLFNQQNIGTYVMDGAAAYAGRASSLAPQNSTTNTPIVNALALGYQFGASVLNALVGLNLVCFTVRSATNQVITVADTTYAPLGSDFQNLSTLRIVYAIMESVRDGVQSFVGMPNNPPNINSMGTAVSQVLRNWKAAGAILDGGYQIVATSAQQISGQTSIMLSLMPALEIKQINVSLQLQAPTAVTLSGSTTNTVNG